MKNNEITIPEWKTHIERGAFEGRDDLTDVMIPDSVTSIGDDACPYCAGKNIYCLDIITNEWMNIENQLLGVDATMLLPISNEAAWLECPTCHYQFTMTLSARKEKKRRNQNPFPRCNGRRQINRYFY